MNLFLKLFFGLWCILFLLFGYWQWNDPDRLVWIGIYGFASLLCAMLVFDRTSIPVLAGSAILAFIGGLSFFPASVFEWINMEVEQADLSMKTYEMEEARESFGLLIISFVLGLAAVVAWHKNRSTKNSRKPV